MGLLRAHLAAVAIVVAAVLATTGVFLVARPQYHPYQMPKPPTDGLSYTTARYTAPTLGARSPQTAFDSSRAPSPDRSRTSTRAT